MHVFHVDFDLDTHQETELRTLGNIKFKNDKHCVFGIEIVFLYYTGSNSIFKTGQRLPGQFVYYNTVPLFSVDILQSPAPKNQNDIHPENRWSEQIIV